MLIQSVVGRKILDSRANWTLEVEVHGDDGTVGRAAVPSGAAAGTYEAVKLTDIDQAVGNVQGIASSLVGKALTAQADIDQTLIGLDGTADKSNLGANVLYGISMAAAAAAASAQGIALYQWIQQLSGHANPSLPDPLFNLINGGKHANNNLPFQEFCIAPKPGASFTDQLAMGLAVARSLKELLHERGHSTTVGDEGGYAPWIHRNEEALDLLVEAIQAAGYQPGTDIALALDVAASNIPDLTAITYPMRSVDYYAKLTEQYPITVLEDPLDQEDWAGWSELTKQLGGRLTVVGDDLFATNAARLGRGITERAANGILVKPDDVGTLTEVLATVKLAQTNNYKVLISHRAGETESTLIADLAVGIGAAFLKAGGLSRSERTAKYNQLKRIAGVLSETGAKSWA